MDSRPVVIYRTIVGTSVRRVAAHNASLEEFLTQLIPRWYSHSQKNDFNQVEYASPALTYCLGESQAYAVSSEEEWAAIPASRIEAESDSLYLGVQNQRPTFITPVLRVFPKNLPSVPSVHLPIGPSTADDSIPFPAGRCDTPPASILTNRVYTHAAASLSLTSNNHRTRGESPLYETCSELDRRLSLSELDDFEDLGSTEGQPTCSNVMEQEASSGDVANGTVGCDLSASAQVGYPSVGQDYLDSTSSTESDSTSAEVSPPVAAVSVEQHAEVRGPPSSGTAATDLSVEQHAEVRGPPSSGTAATDLSVAPMREELSEVVAVCLGRHPPGKPCRVCFPVDTPRWQEQLRVDACLKLLGKLPHSATLVDAIPTLLRRFNDRIVVKTPQLFRVLARCGLERYECGDISSARAIFEQILDLRPPSEVAAAARYNLACMLALQGLSSEAFTLLDEFADRGVLGGVTVAHMQSDGNLDNLRDTARFRSILCRIEASQSRSSASSTSETDLPHSTSSVALRETESRVAAIPADLEHCISFIPVDFRAANAALVAMGFTDVASNLHALQAMDLNLERAVERLLTMCS